jgi:hypothetical protein
MNSLWQKITTPAQNLTPNKAAEKAYVPKPGDNVLHSSGANGVVTAVETIGNVQTLSIECAGGRKLRGLDRREFTLASAEVMAASAAQPAAACAPVPAAEPMPKIEGDGISPESILDELA